ncbi:hypothetical protein G5I_13868 [Acromyrmex echinatior]|uniref:DNA-directed DNA polymerase n=1 Tax=Acromyrmex echinatior TaxID=103372 RepID=F4X663_ACREC|nr:hypothetical protein G5I_13868 [Acromyrmex echinatior]
METLSKQQWERYRSATRCHICEKPFAPDDMRVRDHCHLTSRYHGPAHSNCNLNYKNSFYIPVVFHNLSGYDAHFIIKEIATAYGGHVDILPITKEKYISFTKHINSIKDTNEKNFQKNCIKLRFIDSFKFLNASLDKLASMEHRKMRLLSRRYDLTTGYKFLDIGINVGPPSYVEIALGDHRGHQLLLSLETWKSLYEQRWNIYKMLRNEYKDNFISVGPLTVSVCMLNDATLVRFNSSSVRMMMTEMTLRHELGLFYRLIEVADETDDLKHVSINRTAFNCLIYNFNEGLEEEEEEEE